MSLNCLKLDSNNPVFDLDIWLVHFQSKDDPILLTHRLKNYGYLGIGDKTYITEAVKESAEEAITAYLKVNFDLGED